MNATDLEKLAKAIKERCPESEATWAASTRHPEDMVLRFWSGEVRVSWISIESDLVNAGFIVWAWDRLEELGQAPVITAQWEDGSGCKISMKGSFVEAPTRAEALANALLKVLAVEEPVREES